MELESDLYEALQKDQLSVLYQPQWQIDSGTISAVEASACWIHPNAGTVPTTELMRLAEETGQCRVIGEWLLQIVCRQGVAWRRDGYSPVIFCIALTQHQFHDPNLAKVIETALAQSGMHAAQLELEISESLAMLDVERSVGILRALTILGVRLSIAEFGVAFHSSIEDLQRMPINTIKIDRSLVRDLHTDASNSQWVGRQILLRQCLRLSDE